VGTTSALVVVADGRDLTVTLLAAPVSVDQQVNLMKS
jgi:hypothetical protein